VVETTLLEEDRAALGAAPAELVLKPFEVRTLRLDLAVPSATEEQPARSPQYLLEQPYPNPARQRATIDYRVRSAGHVRIEVFDVLGRKVTTILDGAHHPGRHRVEWRPSRALGSGVYLIVLEAREADGAPITDMQTVSLAR
jgi:hypothetical protein